MVHIREVQNDIIKGKTQEIKQGPPFMLSWSHGTNKYNEYNKIIPSRVFKYNIL